MHTFDISMDKITKVEGSAGLDLRVRDNRVEHVHFKITEYKRFFTQAMRGKPVVAIPQLLARICGTCSNAHLLCSIEACEQALDITPSPQTMLLRILTMYGLNIRDHALHLYLFSLPDIYGKDAFLDFDENDPEQHQLLHDGFEVKSAGNYLATIVAGRSVHAVYPTIGGFTHVPQKQEIEQAIQKLEAARPAVLRLIEIFERSEFHLDRNMHFMALIPERYGFLDGPIQTSLGEVVPEKKFREHLEHVVLPYSQASGYRYKGASYMVGALARLNLAKSKLHPAAAATLGSRLDRFPSTDVFDNNLAQAVEILHCIDDSLEILRSTAFAAEAVIKKPYREAVGIGVVEAPRGTLYHRIELGSDGSVKNGEIVVPTGQNQISIEQDVVTLVNGLLPHTPRERIEHEIEKLIRAYDPCMSCAAHFLKVDWQKV